ncbi:hypothetical protein SAMN05421853_105192 [Roseivivax halotolerans]|uniref:DUF465 domain-containing protein n=1 Tax=Roseivivax halotolerans TaxID=93684 RepID=A0A1I5YEC9_9RHOB|nr:MULTISPECIES: DUF465 domain-containing protein [Roseivivax]QFT63739.1 hypothetical protein FIU91_12440 [Roseivivax sp. THAF30]SFQ42556.1 hypothetical protein SAMN05421853_105192 [Roseivivax halotolerans]
MTHVPHKLPEDFPEHRARIATLRQTDLYFARLADRYDALNAEVHLAETNVVPIDDLAALEIRRERAALKDEVYRILSREPAE